MKKKYFLDTNVYIEAYKNYYARDIVPVYWDILKKLGKNDVIISPVEIRDEIKIQYTPAKNSNQEERFLYDWARNKNECFLDKKLDGIVDFFKKVNLKRLELENIECARFEKKNKFFNRSKIESLSDGDIYLIACLLWYKNFYPKKNLVLVTKETFHSVPKKPIKIPHVCRAFNIEWIDDFSFVKEVGIKFDIDVSKNNINKQL